MTDDTQRPTAEPLVRGLIVSRAMIWRHKPGTLPIWRVQIGGWSRLVRAESTAHAIGRTLRHIGAA